MCNSTNNEKNKDEINECEDMQGKDDCFSTYNCCNCGGNNCFCSGCFSCNACSVCLDDD